MSVLMRIFDAIIVVTMARFAYSLWLGTWIVPKHYELGYTVSVFATVLVFNHFRLYRVWRGGSKSEEIKNVFYALASTFVILAIASAMTKTTDSYSRGWFLIWWGLSFVVIGGYRFVVRLILNVLRKKGYNQRSIVIIGSGAIVERLVATVEENRWIGLQLKGVLGDDLGHLGKTQVLGGYEDVVTYLETNTVDQVWVAIPLNQMDKIKDVLADLSLFSTTIKYVPDVFDFNLLNHSVGSIANIPVINLTDSPNEGINAFIKRCEDIILSSIILFLVSPLMLGLALGVKLTSKGPVFYRQERIGWNGAKFNMFKFRSMPVDVEQNGVKWGSANEKTKTKFGAFIRKTSLDELPQFLNVLKGDMSIVGPRPERTVFVDQFKKEIPRYMQKHVMKAGITGWAQVNGWRGDTNLHKRIECDLFYIENWSIWFDLKIIVLTVLAGFFNLNFKR
ncbi:sugar transferase involved in lipopolysaccharide synthesis [Gynuella sunshinyii YC6258]|uniref:Sugar transferase involved in lipopolysaccharide synthesis n=1 Tax=Gynuella sunshinyii YC6258 TaxID=1445510 RepID=A0A0C5VPI8_9GAMM|nr:sugar transferase involved in lipopolysaccharide synthesis [Gynuella sunshinyii YC6258]